MNEKIEKSVFISKMNKGMTFNDYFMISDFKKKIKRDGNPYLTVEFMDKSGRIEGKIWDNIIQFESILKPGIIYKVKGFVNEYQGKNELKIDGINIVGESENLNMEDFEETPDFDTESVLSEMISLLKREVTSEYLKKLFDIFYKKYGKPFRIHFGAMKIHHAYPGGLLQHTFSVVKILLKLGQHYDVDLNVLLAGGLFHDLGKIDEFSITPAVKITNRGGLLGHIVIGENMFNELIAEIDGFPSDLAEKIKHLIISHHGEKEFGSPEIPKTREALILHIADLLDSKMDIFGKSINLSDEDSLFTDYIPILGRRLFKG